jgi:hypothetical protein
MCSSPLSLSTGDHVGYMDTHGQLHVATIAEDVEDVSDIGNIVTEPESGQWDRLVSVVAKLNDVVMALTAEPKDDNG